MARKKEGTLEVLGVLLRWVNIMVFAGAYFGMAVVIPIFAGRSANAGVCGVLTGLSQLAPFGSAPGW